MERVVVTGMGAVTSLGKTADELINNVFSGKSGIGAITLFDSTEIDIGIASEVKDFDPNDRTDKKMNKRMDRFSQFAVYAADEAVKQANINRENTQPEDLGVIIGSGIGGLGTMEQQILKMKEKGPKRVHSLFIPMTIGNMAAGNVALANEARNICTSVVTACASGTNAVGEAFDRLRLGRAKVMIAGGTEATIDQIGVAGFANLKALSQNTDLATASRPFDTNRDGFVMGEGAGILVLETLSHAQKRQATILGEIIGYGATCDAYHMTAPHPEGKGAAAAMQAAIQDANLVSDQIDYINAHGTSTLANDIAETKAINTVFGDATPFVSSTKGATGHLLGAAGAVEAILSIASLNRQQVPPTLGTTDISDCAGINIVLKTKPYKGEYALSNSFGFGGHNAVLAFRRYQENG